jgi:anti-sigma28 factor (negative regulator of flagellin synthesis)
MEEPARTVRLASLRAAVVAGTYPLDPQAIASAILRQALLRLRFRPSA